MIKNSTKKVLNNGNEFEKKAITEQKTHNASVTKPSAPLKKKKKVGAKLKKKSSIIFEKLINSKSSKTNKKPQKSLIKQNLTLSVDVKTKQTKTKIKYKTKQMKITNPTHKSKPLISKVNDTLSDMLTRIRNAQQAKHNTVKIIHTKLNLKIMRLLKNEGYIKQGLRSRPSVNKPYIMIYLKYLTADKIPCISQLHRVSSPGLRHYVGYKDLPKVLNGMGVSVLTTPKGIMTDKQARRQKVGGELLFEIY
jgi:small subunit ribosomal protein S8